MKTRGLNVKYRINDYHIGRKKEQFILYTEENNNDNLKDIKIDSITN